MRGAGMSRIEAFSDVVLGFALTLLVVSLEVPRNFSELHEAFRGFIPFAIGFAILLTVWHSHYVFFRRYGMHDQFTIVLNSILLFVILFYVYPLKFLFSALVSQVHGQEAASRIASAGHAMELMVLYGLGFAAVYILLGLMYWNAWRNRERMEFNGVERLLTVYSIVDAVGLAAIGLIACLFALLAYFLLPAAFIGASGYIYFLIAPWKTLNGMYFGRKARTLRKLVTAPTL